MYIELITLIALLVSLLSLIYLCKTDPKRRRTYKRKLIVKNRYQSLAWLICLLPGIILILLELYPAFVMWAAALTLIGWLVAIKKPSSVNTK